MNAETISRYVPPRRWLQYDAAAIFDLLVQAKTAAGVLNRMPHLRQWIEQIHETQLRLEAVGTSRIEGAEFTRREQEEALSDAVPTLADLTRSQRQLRSANAAYRWLQSLPSDRPVNASLILDIHRRIVTGCDDDHCEPGALRTANRNVVFGMPPCRGVEGGADCSATFETLCGAISGEFQRHDRIIQALGAHYHIGAMHPFDDGNGRTARALEAFMLRNAGVNNMVMVSLSNYYYEHSDEYRAALYETRRNGHDLTPFLRFALRAIAERCNALAGEIALNHKRVLVREFAEALFGRLRSPRRRVLAERQMRIIQVVLDGGSMDFLSLAEHTDVYYESLKFPVQALLRDLFFLIRLGVISTDDERSISVNLDWPQQFSETELLERYESMQSAASARHPAMSELSRLLRRRV